MSLKLVHPYRDKGVVAFEPWREPVGDLFVCPFCNAGRKWNHWEEAPCERRDSQGTACGTVPEHLHSGADYGRACGYGISWWRRLWRWCFRSEPHLHQGCTECGGRWTCLAQDRTKLLPPRRA